MRQRRAQGAHGILLDVKHKKQSAERFLANEMLNLYKSLADISSNAKLKLYPDGSGVLTIANKAIFKEKGWESSKQKIRQSVERCVDAEPREDSVKRAKEKIIDITRLNEFSHFITWTLDGQKIDRTDPIIISKKLKTFLMNKVKRNNLIYLVIPEYHKDNQSIHIHGTINSDFEMVDSNRRTKNNQIIYNIPQWKYGFSTAIELDNNRKLVSHYITKYLSKDFRMIFGNFYYAGGNIVREPPTRLLNIDYDAVKSREYSNEYLSFKYLEFENIDAIEIFMQNLQKGRD